MIDDRSATKRFVLGACSSLGFEVTQADGVYRCALPEDDAPGAEVVLFQGDRAFTFSFEKSEEENGKAQSSNGSSYLVTADSPLVDWLVQQLNDAQSNGTTRTLHARPSDQPKTVHEISDRLFAAYTIDNGTAHLSGCRLEDRPFTCLTYRSTEEGNPRLVEALVDPEGKRVEEDRQNVLRLTQTAPLPKPPVRLDQESQQRLVDAAIRGAGKAPDSSADEPSENQEIGGSRQGLDSAIESEIAQSDATATKRESTGVKSLATNEPLAATLVWCKWAVGKLCFTIGEESIELPFEGWATTLEAPAFACLPGGKESFHLAATDDGRITAEEAIAVCQQSNRRVLSDELKQCTVTGRRVLPEFLVLCEATDKLLLESEQVACPGCRLRVSPSSLLGKGCLACQRTSPVRPSDPRLARVLGEYPGLGRWWSWRLAETPSAYILKLTRLLRSQLVVLDKQTLEVTHLAQGNRFSSAWGALPERHWEENLR